MKEWTPYVILVIILLLLLTVIGFNLESSIPRSSRIFDGTITGVEMNPRDESVSSYSIRLNGFEDYTVYTVSESQNPLLLGSKVEIKCNYRKVADFKDFAPSKCQLLTGEFEK